MIWTMLAAQAAAAVPIPAEARAKYEPYRQCLLSLAGRVEIAGQSDESIIAAVRQVCMSANLAGGSNALLAAVGAGVPKDEAIEAVAAVRHSIEADAVTAIRATPFKKR